jgi:hypothetical protein
MAGSDRRSLGPVEAKKYAPSSGRFYGQSSNVTTSAPAVP